MNVLGRQEELINGKLAESVEVHDNVTAVQKEIMEFRVRAQSKNEIVCSRILLLPV